MTTDLQKLKTDARVEILQSKLVPGLWCEGLTKAAASPFVVYPWFLQ